LAVRRKTAVTAGMRGEGGGEAPIAVAKGDRLEGRGRKGEGGTTNSPRWEGAGLREWGGRQTGGTKDRSVRGGRDFREKDRSGRGRKDFPLLKKKAEEAVGPREAG